VDTKMHLINLKSRHFAFAPSPKCDSGFKLNNYYNAGMSRTIQSHRIAAEMEII